MKILCSFIVMCLCDIFYAGAQDCSINEKEQIDSMVLSKVWAINTPMGKILTTDDPHQIDGEERWYFDSEDNLRKLISWWDYSDSSLATIAYYNEEGELMYILFKNLQPAEYSYQGSARTTTCEMDGDSIYFDYKMQYSSMSDFEDIRVSGVANRYPSITKYNVLSPYLHADSLKTHLQTDPVSITQNGERVTFGRPVKNQTSFINRTDVRVRVAAMTSAKIIAKVDAGDKVKIVAVLPEQTIDRLGKYPWYQVEVSGIVGYIFGAFVEPVERIITN